MTDRQREMLQSPYKYTFNTRRADYKTIDTVLMAKLDPNLVVVVPDVKHMDKLIRMGVKPSQLAMPSEFTNSSRFNTMSMDGMPIGSIDVAHSVEAQNGRGDSQRTRKHNDQNNASHGTEAQLRG